MKKHGCFLLALLLTALAFGQRPKASFSAQQVSGCAPVVVNFQDLSTGTPTSWHWEFGNGATSTLQNPSAVFFTPGTYTVKLVATNNSGTDSLIRLNYITVYDKPKVDFSTSKTTGCFPFPVSFTDASVAAAGTTNIDWEWDFGNGVQSAQHTPTYTYRAAGDHTVSLKVTNDKGCFATLSKPAYIHIPNGVKASFEKSNINQCRVPYPVSFTSTSTGPGTLTYAWDFGDGTTASQANVAHNYTSAGSYSVSLAVSSSSGCSDTVRKQDLVPVPNINTSFTAPDTVCERTPVSFANTSSPPPQSTRWDFGDGTTNASVNTTKAFSRTGTYTVRLVNAYATCTDSSFKIIQVVSKPAISFTANQTRTCKPPFTVTFADNTANAIGWLWDFGDNTTSTEKNPVHTYTDYGNFNVTLIVTNRLGCADTLRRTSYVRVRKPVISFPNLPQEGCIPYQASFSATVNTQDQVISRLWDFGDGTTATSTSPMHVYNSQGDYTVTLTVTTSTGCTETLTKAEAISVGRKPVISFTAAPNPACAFQDVLFRGTVNEGGKFVWHFGDNTISNSRNPTHAYTDTGVFNVILSAYNNGCRDSLKKTAFIQVRPPIAKFGVVKNCSKYNEFQFIDSSVGPTSWFWNFGDGTTSTAQSPVHPYAKDSTYPVSLTVTNGTCSHTLTRTISVFRIVPSFTADKLEACKPATISYNAGSNPPAGVTSYAWQFAAGKTADTLNPRVVYDSAGSFSTTLITTDMYGCKDTAFQKDFIRINGPTAGFFTTNSGGCKGFTTDFTDASVTDGRHSISEWQWLFGDGRSATFTDRRLFQHTYADTGIYAVKLIVTDAAGCKDSLQIDSLVKVSSPRAAFSSADTLTCLGSVVQLTNLTSSPAFTSQWNFGDNTTSQNQDPVHVYRDTGSYTISLKISDAFGCSDSVSVPNYIGIRKTAASFSLSDSTGGCTPFNVSFADESQFSDALLWRIGKDTSTASHLSYTFALAGTYPVTLIATGRGGCVDSVSKTIVVHDASATRLSYTALNECMPVLLSASVSSPAKMTYAWDFGDGNLVTTTSKDTTHVFTSFGDFVPKLIATDSASCVLALTGADTIHVKGVLANFKWDNQVLCDSGTVRFTDSTTGMLTGSYAWSFGDGGSSTDASPAHTYRQPGAYTVSLAVQTATQCKDTATIQGLIKVVQSPSIGIAGDSIVCKNAASTQNGIFIQPDTSVVRWMWQFPNGASATSIRPPAQHYATAGELMIRAIAINSSGCADTATKTIRVNDLPSVQLPDTMMTAAGAPVLLQPSITPAGPVTFQWSPSDGLSCTTCSQPVARPRVNTSYEVVVTDENGCRNAASVRVVIFCRSSDVFVPNTFSPNNDGSNDVFYVRGAGVARVKSLRIFNRFGEVVFARQNFPANDAASGWDGTYKGTKLPPDTYIFQMEAFCENNAIVHIDGSVTLIR